MTNPIQSSTGGADFEKLKKIGSSGSGAISDEDPVAWDPNWQQRFDDWKTATDSLSPITLIFCSSPAIIGNEFGCERIFQLGAISKRPKCGVYLVGRAASGNAWMLPESSEDYQKNCELITTAKLQNYPSIVVGLSSSKVLFYPKGIEDGDGIELPPPVAGSAFDDEVLSLELEHFANKSLISPEIRSDLWKDAGKFWAIENAEVTIQKYLLICLRSVFKNNEFLAETSVPAGRIDILILPGKSSESGRSVLELKALREFGSTGNKYTSDMLEKHIKGGIIQALTYIEDVTHKYLCAYDMRENMDSTIFDSVKSDAVNFGVKIKHYKVFNGAVAIRNDLASNMSKQY